MRKTPKVRAPMRPRRDRSPSPVTPSTSEVNTRGITIMKSMRRKTSPTGAATWLTSQTTAGASFHSTLAAPPAEQDGGEDGRRVGGKVLEDLPEGEAVVRALDEGPWNRLGVHRRSFRPEGP